MTSRDLALAVVRDVFPAPGHDGRARGAHEAFEYRAGRSGLDARDRAFAAELVYGSIKARRLLDWLLAPFVGDRVAELPPTIVETLRLGAYQLTRMAVPPRAAVSETVALARRHGHRGTAGLVNAVLRRIAQLSEQDRTPQRERFGSEDDFLGTRYSFPTWIVAALRSAFGGERLEAILRGMNGPAQPALRVDLLRATRGEAIEVLRSQGASVRPSELAHEIVLVDGAPSGSLEDPRRRWEPQGEIAAVPVDLLDPRPRARGLELCSGRGNKTLQIVGRTGDRGRLEAVENDPRKVATARERLQRLGITSVEVHEGDATRPAGDADADFVLVDAPCSGLGILGRQPEARWRKDPRDPERLARLQAALLEAAGRRVAPGGRLVYSVCTFDPKEGRERIDAFTRLHPEFSPAPVPARYLPWRCGPGELLFPPGLERRDGFFIACLERATRA
jgi:16S rRNA (cytosine967-C5)-methyltransferase